MYLFCIAIPVFKKAFLTSIKMINCLYSSVLKGKDIFPCGKKIKIQLLGKYKAGEKKLKLSETSEGEEKWGQSDVRLPRPGNKSIVNDKQELKKTAAAIRKKE